MTASVQIDDAPDGLVFEQNRHHRRVLNEEEGKRRRERPRRTWWQAETCWIPGGIDSSPPLCAVWRERRLPSERSGEVRRVLIDPEAGQIRRRPLRSGRGSPRKEYDGRT